MDEPLEDAKVIQDLDEGDEEDDGRDDPGQEPTQLEDRGVGQEFGALVGEPEQVSRQAGDEVENVIARLCAQDKDGDDKLGQHAPDDRVPADLAAVAGRDPQQGQHDGEAQQGDGAVAASVVGRLLGHKRPDQDDGEGDQGGQRESQFLGNHLVDSHARVVPDKVHGHGDDGDGRPEKDQAQRDGEVQQKGDQPAQVVTMEDEAGDPPANDFRTRQDSDFSGERTSCHGW